MSTPHQKWSICLFFLYDPTPLRITIPGKKDSPTITHHSMWGKINGEESENLSWEKTLFFAVVLRLLIWKRKRGEWSLRFLIILTVLYVTGKLKTKSIYVDSACLLFWYFCGFQVDFSVFWNFWCLMLIFLIFSAFWNCRSIFMIVLLLWELFPKWWVV